MSNLLQEIKVDREKHKMYINFVNEKGEKGSVVVDQSRFEMDITKGDNPRKVKAPKGFVFINLPGDKKDAKPSKLEEFSMI